MLSSLTKNATHELSLLIKRNATLMILIRHAYRTHNEALSDLLAEYKANTKRMLKELVTLSSIKVW